MANSLLGVGDYFRNSSRVWLYGFSKFIRSGEVIQRDLWAIFLGLQLASNVPFLSKIEIETDSSKVIKLFHSHFAFHPLTTLIENCKSLLFEFEDWKLTKIARNQNKCADVLAKEGRKEKLSLSTYDAPPNFVIHHNLADLSSALTSS